MGTITAITNQKGGVGKTTTAVSLAAGLNIKGKNSLLIDLDSQGNASAASGLELEDDGETLKDLILSDGKPDDYVVKKDPINIIPSNNSLKDVEDLLLKKDGFDWLQNTLKPIKDEYDHIVLDCPPSINIFTKNALAASDYIIIPVDVGYFSLIGLKQLLEEIDYIKEHLNSHLLLRGVLACRYDRRTTLSEQVLETLKINFPEQVFRTVIRMNIDIVRSQIAQKNIFDYSPRSAGAEDYNAFIEEIING